MVVIGIDSAELSGLAVVARDPGARERVVYSAVATVTTAADVEAIVHQLAAHAPDLVVVEEPWVHPRMPLAGLVLARLCGRWLQALETRGLTTVTIPASMWQPGLLGGPKGLLGARATRPQRKAAAQTWVRSVFGIDATEDQADAICMATYALRNASRTAPPRAA